ncbi:12227_t:CDS:2, partial [Entrophospora sp. SA101]
MVIDESNRFVNNDDDSDEKDREFGTKELDLNNIQHDLHNNKPIEKSINAFSDTADLTDFYSKLIRHCKIGIK